MSTFFRLRVLSVSKGSVLGSTFNVNLNDLRYVEVCIPMCEHSDNGKIEFIT